MADLPVLNRPAFFDGQQLTAADLDAVRRYHEELLWLHQRYLHNWGIASGLTVTGAKGATTVEVSPGYAVDAEGRSIVLTTPEALTVPAIMGSPAGGPMTYQLTISWAADAELRRVVRSGVCDSDGATLLLDRPLLRWQEPVAVRHAYDLVLATVKVANCRLAATAELAPRQSALPERQPYLYAGQTRIGQTGWALWRAEGAGADERPLGLQALVDTSAAGFGNTPRYQAQVLGNRQFGGKAIVDGHVNVEQPSPTGFLLRMTLPTIQGGQVNPAAVVTAGDFLKQVTERWSVGWLGVES